MSKSTSSPTEGSDPLERAFREFLAAFREDRNLDLDVFLRDHPECPGELRERIGRYLRSLEGSPTAAFTAPDLTDEETRLGSGRVLGDFRIVRWVGGGGMGDVYLAEQISLRRLVALKVLSLHATLRPEGVERFRREASIASRVRHPGIVEIYAIAEHEGTHYFSMEFLEGAPLDLVISRLQTERLEQLDGERFRAAVATEALKKATPPSGGRAKAPPASGAPGPEWRRTHVQTACELVAKVADALEHAHEAGVIHRDVKPSNIVVRVDGTPVLTDFGIAREEGLPSLTFTGQLGGTPYYISPEQAMAKRVRVDHRTDIYSLGVTFYELLTLRRPFEGETQAEVLGRIIGKDPPNPRRWNRRIPRDLVTVLLKAIDKDPDVRYSTAASFAADLRAFLAGRPIAARRLGPAVRIVRFVRRHRTGAVAASIPLIAAAAATAWWMGQRGALGPITAVYGGQAVQGASVFLDDVPVGVTPLSKRELPPGGHRIRVAKGDDLYSEDLTVSVRRLAVTPIPPIPLMSRSGYLILESDLTAADVEVQDESGGEMLSARPMPASVRVRAGRYVVVASAPGFEELRDTVEVKPADSVTKWVATWPFSRAHLLRRRADQERALADARESGNDLWLAGALRDLGGTLSRLGENSRPFFDEASETEARILEFDFEAKILAVRDGQDVHMKHGDVTHPGESLVLEIKGSRNLYVYVFNVDETLATSVLFPVPGYDLQNPLAASEVHRLPGTHGGDRHNYVLGGSPTVLGVETFVVFASVYPIPEAEELLASKPPVGPGDPSYIMVEPRSRGAFLRGTTRGVNKTRPDPSASDGDALHAPLPDEFATLACLEEGPSRARGIWGTRLSLRRLPPRAGG